MDDFIFIFLVTINILGFLTLPFYYGSQLLRTNPLLWVFVPDCQLAALFFAITMTLIFVGREKKWVTQLGIASGFKYGAWTLIVLLSNMNYYGNSFDYWVLVVAHIILTLQSLLIIKKFKLSKASIPAFTFLLLNDTSDYLLGTHPTLPGYYIPFISILTPIITLGLIGLSYYISKKS